MNNFNGHSGMVQHGKTSCRISAYKDGVFLTSLYTPPEERGKRHARIVLEEAKGIAASLDLPLELGVDPYADHHLDEELLVQFYLSCGFNFYRAGNYANSTIRMRYTP